MCEQSSPVPKGLLTTMENYVCCIYLFASFAAVTSLQSGHVSVGSDSAIMSPRPAGGLWGRNETDCFRNVCRCYKRTADCSRNYGRLEFVPDLPAKVRRLIFSYNNVTKIWDDGFFHNLTRVVYLDMENNGLEYISQGVFRPLTRLGTLRLGYNSLTYMAVAPVFWAKRLSNLYLIYMDLGPVPGDWFSQKPVPPLELLDLSGNPIQHLQLSMFLPLKKLSRLIVADSRLYGVTSVHFPQMMFLDLQSNALFELPESCGNGSSLFPRLQVINLSQNKFSGFHEDICLPALQYLHLNRNPIDVMVTDMFSRDRFPSLLLLSLEYVVGISRMEKYAFRSPTLQTLSLMYCAIPFSDDTVDPDTFAGIPNLKQLQISHNLGTGISKEKFSQLFGTLTNLEQLYMGKNGIYSISKDTFSNLTRLTTLYLYRNKIPEIPDGAFDSLPNLTRLNFNDNQLHVIRESTFSSTTRQRLRHLDVSRNPLVCNCDLLWFQKWFESTPALFAHSYKNYTCTSPQEIRLTSFVLNEQACVLSRETNRMLVACVMIFLCLLFALSVMYQYRWHIRLMLAFRGHGEIMRRRLLVEDLQYDVFLSSAEEDEAWVLQHLLPHLEGRLGLRTCFHKRDFLPGKNILENIVDSVKTSKKFVMVFSKNFALSRWCQFELALCLGHVFDNDDALIVTMVDEASSRDLTSTMMAVMKTTTYIKWEEHSYVRTSFWRRLDLSLKDIML